MTSFDMIVIGSGPAGQRAAIQGAKSGKRVAVVERRECVGGACINTGTIPSKTLREAVLHLSGYAYQGVYGVNYRVKEKITMADLAFRVQHVIKTEIDVTISQLTRNGVEMLFGLASFVDPHTIRITNLTGSVDYHAENIIIATGTKPAVSSKVPYNNRNIINSDQILNMTEIPSDLYRGGRRGHRRGNSTCMFATLGVRMILVEKRPRLLEFSRLEKHRVEASLLPPARQPRDHAAQRRSLERRGTARRQCSGEPGEQQKDHRQRAALRSGPPGQRR